MGPLDIEEKDLPQEDEEKDPNSWQFGEVGTGGTKINEKINKALTSIYHKIPEKYRTAIREGAQQGWESGSTMATGEPNPIQTQDLAPLLNLIPSVLKYKAARSIASRTLNVNPELFDKAAISYGITNVAQKGVKKVIPEIQYKTGQKLRPYTGTKAGAIDIGNIGNKEKIMNEVFQIKDFTSGSIRKGGLFDPNAYGSLGSIYTSTSEYSDMYWANVRGSSLHPGGPTGRFPRGESRKLTSELTTGIKTTPELEQKFKGYGITLKKAIEKNLEISIGKEAIHHKGILRQIWESMNGLDHDHVTLSRRYYQRELGFKLGNHITNATPLPELFHPMLHAVMNKRLGGKGGSYTLKGLEESLNLPKNWQRTLIYTKRKVIYDEIIDTIRDSLKDINTFWQVTASRTNRLGNIPPEKFVQITQDLINLDDRILNAGTTLGRQSPNIKTASDVVNNMLINAGKVDLTLPKFSKLNTSDLEVVAKAELINKAILREALVSKQSANTVFNAYKDVLGVSRSQWNSILNQIDPNKLIQQGMSIDDIDTYLSTGWADPTKAKSSLKPLTELGRTDYSIKELQDMGYSITDIENARNAGWNIKIDSKNEILNNIFDD